MNSTYLAVHVQNCRHHIQLGPGDSMSFPNVFGVSKVSDSFWNSYEIFKERRVEDCTHIRKGERQLVF